MAEHAGELKGDVNKGLIVCGTSAGKSFHRYRLLIAQDVDDCIGANIAAAIAIRARDDPEFKWKVTGQVLMHPGLYSKKLHPIEKYAILYWLLIGAELRGEGIKTI